MTRADAVRNRERVLVAALDVFDEQGPDAGVDAVARRAGVGKATVYRSFPTKEHLVSAVLSRQVEPWLDRLERADGTALDVLRATLADAAEAKAAKVIGGIAGSELHVAALQTVRDRWRAGLQALLERGRVDGSVRPDVSADEVVVLFGGVCRVLTERREPDPAVWRRHAQLVVDGLRA